MSENNVSELVRGFFANEHVILAAYNGKQAAAVRFSAHVLAGEVDFTKNTNESIVIALATVVMKAVMEGRKVYVTQFLPKISSAYESGAKKFAKNGKNTAERMELSLSVSHDAFIAKRLAHGVSLENAENEFRAKLAKRAENASKLLSMATMTQNTETVE